MEPLTKKEHNTGRRKWQYLVQIQRFTKKTILGYKNYMQKGHTRRKTYQVPKGDLLQKSSVTQSCPQPYHYSTPITFRKLNDCCSKDNECENNLQTEVLLL